MGSGLGVSGPGPPSSLCLRWRPSALLCPAEGSRCPAAAGGAGRTGRKGLSSGPEEREEEVTGCGVGHTHLSAYFPGPEQPSERKLVAHLSPTCKEHEEASLRCGDQAFIFLAGSGADCTNYTGAPSPATPGFDGRGSLAVIPPLLGRLAAAHRQPGRAGRTRVHSFTIIVGSWPYQSQSHGVESQ